MCVTSIIYKGEKLSANHVSNHDSPKKGGSKMIVTTQVTTEAPTVMTQISNIYSGSKMSANHASNHGATPKSPSEKTYSIYKLYINIFNIILLYWERKRARARMYAHAKAHGLKPPKAVAQKK